MSLLALSITASIWVSVRDQRPDADVGGVAPATRVRAELELKHSEPASLAIPIHRFPDTSIVEQRRDPFATRYPKQDIPLPPPSVAPPAEAAQVVYPTAPPLPFSYRGFLTDGDGAWLVQLGRGNDYLLAGPGDVIDSVYRLDALNEDEIRFTYLPLATVQVLSLPPSQP
jgi:hypothetical protein